MVRQYGVWLALLLTLVASYWVTIQEGAHDDDAKEIRGKQAIQKNVHQQARKPIEITLSKRSKDDKLLLRSPDLATPSNLFSSFETAEDATLVDTQNQASSLPINPYAYAGKITDNGDWTVFLTDGTKNFAVKAGDVLEGGWRVHLIKQAQLILIYQPLKKEITLDTGAKF